MPKSGKWRTAEICNLSSYPGTNTVAVPIRRVRLRLAEFGLAHSIVTDDKGRYWFDQQAAAQTVAAEERMPT